MSKWLTGGRKCTQYRFTWYTQSRYRHGYTQVQIHIYGRYRVYKVLLETPMVSLPPL